MSLTSSIVVDGLWRALCPSIDAILCSSYPSATVSQSLPFPKPHPRPQQRPRARPAFQLLTGQRTGRCNTSLTTFRPRQRCQARCLHSSVASPSTELPATESSAARAVTAPSGNSNNVHTPPNQSSTAAAYERLRELRTQKGKADAIRKQVQSLIDSGEKANIFLYEALVAANWDTTGSAAELELILRASDKADIPPSSNLYHDALRLLAIHPDYALRAAILDDMRFRNMPLTADGQLSVALGYLRDGQYELALDRLDELLLHDANTVPAWGWDIFIYTLGNLGFVDEAFRLLRQRLQMSTSEHGADSIRPSMWYFLLDECSKALHHEGTAFIWNRLVEPTSSSSSPVINPSDGTTLAVLNTAARHGDSALATQAIQHLSRKRNIKLGLHHYEPLLDCYAHSGDLENAFRVLCIMDDAGLKTDPASTRSLYAALRRAAPPPPPLLLPGQQTTPTGTEILRSLAETTTTHKTIPTSAMNVLIEALDYPNDNDEKKKAWDAAVDIYQQLRPLCRQGPNKRTFDLLRERAAGSSSSNAAANIRFVVTELYMSGLRRDWSMYDALVYAYTLDDRPDDAFRFLHKIASQEKDQREREREKKAGEAVAGSEENNKKKQQNGHWLRQRTLFALLECCFRHADERAWWLIDEARRKGVKIARERILEWVELARRMEEERGRAEGVSDSGSGEADADAGVGVKDARVGVDTL